MNIAIRTKVSSHAVSAIMATLVSIAVQRHYGAVMENDLGRWSADQFVVAGALPFGIFLLVFLGAHLLLSARGIGNQVVYSGVGCGAALTAFAATAYSTTIPRAIETGTLSIVLGLVAAAGSLIGFLHVRSAGYATEGDEPDQLAGRLRLIEGSASAPGATTSQISRPAESVPQSQEPAHVTLPAAEYYDGPLQVATSFKAMVLAAMVGGVVMTFWMTVVFAVFSDGSLWVEDVVYEDGIVQLATSLIFFCVLCLFLLTPFIYGCHLFARARKKTTAKDYAVIGAIAPIVIGLAIFIVGIMVTHYFVLPMAVAMATYHKLAGLEPAELPDDIEVRDRRTLVGADHARRRYRRVVG